MKGFQGKIRNDYFQSDSYYNNPLRKNNELREKRAKLLSDSKFVFEHERLARFLLSKGVTPSRDDTVNFERLMWDIFLKEN